MPGKSLIAIGAVVLTAAVGVTQALAGGTAGIAAKRGTLIKVAKTSHGTALVNRGGRAVYRFLIERGKAPLCNDASCTYNWPPLLTSGKPVAGDGVQSGKLGTVTRTDGTRQVTYANHPLYYYFLDSSGTTQGQGLVEFGGRWQLVRPNGSPLG